MNQPAGFHRHGGRLADAARAFAGAPEPWIDLSTGINPQPWLGPRADLAALRRLPDPAETAALEAAAAAAFGVADATLVAAVPGAEAGLRLLPRVTGASSVAVFSPTYGGHAEAWAAVGREVRLIEWGQALPETGAVVLVNPNNPDGRAVAPDEVCRMVAPERWLIVDESFGDIDPGLSVAPRAGGRLVVLRSFGKFFGLAGVRLGFVVADPVVIAQVRAAFGDWPVSAEALAAGRGAYNDPAWMAATRERLVRDAVRLDDMLTGAGLAVLGGTTLFRLCATERPQDWFTHLARHGLLVRPFEKQPRWLRFGLPGDEAEWERLRAALDSGPA
jgi:cobalamin biosynthesis protein CobC